jgi:hypothetical protein
MYLTMVAMKKTTANSKIPVKAGFSASWTGN